MSNLASALRCLYLVTSLSTIWTNHSPPILFTDAKSVPSLSSFSPLSKSSSSSSLKSKPKAPSPFHPLAWVLFQKLVDNNIIDIDASETQTLDDKHNDKHKHEVQMEKITRALQSLSASQTTLKRLDGVAHEAYQRTHSNSLGGSSDHHNGEDYDDDQDDDEKDMKVSGRVTRSAGRAGCVADSLLACELCELLDVDVDVSISPPIFQDPKLLQELCEPGGTLHQRQILYNETHLHVQDDKLQTVSVLILYEPDYTGGVGFNHGGIDDILLDDSRHHDPLHSDNAQSQQPQHKQQINPTTSTSTTPRGRILIILSDRLSNRLPQTLQYLDTPPLPIKLSSGLIANEVASVHPGLYRAAGKILEALHPTLVNVSDSNAISLDPSNTTSLLNLNATTAIATDDDDYDDDYDKDNEIVSASQNLEKETQNLQPAIHIVGRSLAGGIASIMAAILDGTLPMPDSPSNAARRKGKGKGSRKRGGKARKQGASSSKTTTTSSTTTTSLTSSSISTSRERKSSSRNTHNSTSTATNTISTLSISGYAQGRTSAVALGPPPCLSPNIKASYITSVIHGDDIVSRTTHQSITKLLERTQKAMKLGFLGQTVGWVSVTDAVSLTVNSVKAHAYGSEGEEVRLAIPGKTYLIRPRRLGGLSSLHEVGGVVGASSGREAIRAAVLWQLNDILLSPSMWTHHSLDGYIHGLDRVQLREFRQLNKNSYPNGDYDGQEEHVMST